MNTTRMMVVATLITGSGLAALVTSAQQPGISRSDVVRHDLAVAGPEVIQVRVDFANGVAFARHSHPGAEVAYVLEGTLEYQLDGAPPVTLKTGEALFIAPRRFTQRKTSAPATPRNSRRTSLKKQSRSSCWPSEPAHCLTSWQRSASTSARMASTCRTTRWRLLSLANGTASASPLPGNSTRDICLCSRRQCIDRVLLLSGDSSCHARSTNSAADSSAPWR